jgi:Flp pilus assembly pilin Flp
VTFSDYLAYFRARFAVEEGQTMAEYGVVLAVICALTAGAFVLLRGGIINSINNVLPFLN